MKESAHSICTNAQLVGVLTETNLTSEQKPTVLLLNSGLLGRTGPFRLHVQLARQLAKTGFNTFRLDLSGIGDSERLKDKRSNSEKHLGDIQQVMDYLTKETGAQSFIIMGICTGADNAHKTMLKDMRVLGAVCIDGYTYPTAKYYINYYLPRLFSLKTWCNHMQTICSKIFNYSAGEAELLDDKKLNYRWTLPEKEKTKTDLQKFIDRNAKLLCLYTSTWPYNYTNQLADAFPSLDFGDNIKLAYLNDATHTFPVLEDRELLINTISNWLQTNFNLTDNNPVSQD